MSKSELKRQCVMNPLEMAEKITELSNKLAAAETRIMQLESAQMDAYDAESHKSYLEGKQAGRDEVLKELSAQEPFMYISSATGDRCEGTDRLAMAMLIRPQPPSEKVLEYPAEGTPFFLRKQAC